MLHVLAYDHWELNYINDYHLRSFELIWKQIFNNCRVYIEADILRVLKLFDLILQQQQKIIISKWGQLFPEKTKTKSCEIVLSMRASAYLQNYTFIENFTFFLVKQYSCK